MLPRVYGEIVSSSSPFACLSCLKVGLLLCGFENVITPELIIDVEVWVIFAITATLTHIYILFCMDGSLS